MPGSNPRAALQTTVPAKDLDLRSFPTRAVEAQTSWYRSHQGIPAERALQPFWFSSSLTGRFDLPAPEGTCYLANSKECAAREMVGPSLARLRYIPESVVTQKVVSHVLLPHDVLAANLTSGDTLQFGGVGLELVTTSQYWLPQAWAQQLHGAGMTAIWYQPRFSDAQGRALALFGKSGLHDGKPADSVPLGEVCATMGYRVLRKPPRTALKILS